MRQEVGFFLFASIGIYFFVHLVSEKMSQSCLNWDPISMYLQI